MAESARQAAVVYANSLPQCTPDEPLTVVSLTDPVGGCSQVTSASHATGHQPVGDFPGALLAIYRR